MKHVVYTLHLKLFNNTNEMKLENVTVQDSFRRSLLRGKCENWDIIVGNRVRRVSAL
jgi:hypothetical protein